jgi:hypothetical protein
MRSLRSPVKRREKATLDAGSQQVRRALNVVPLAVKANSECASSSKISASFEESTRTSSGAQTREPQATSLRRVFCEVDAGPDCDGNYNTNSYLGPAAR